MKKHIVSVFTLFLICAIVAVALAVCYEITAPIILERQQAAASGALAEVMPDGGTFEKVDISTYTLPATIKEAHKASNGGYVLQVEFADNEDLEALLVKLCGKNIIEGVL